MLAALLDVSRNHQQRLQLGRDVRVLEVMLYLLNQRLIAIEVCRRDGAMSHLTVVTVILRGDVGRDQLALAGGERVRAAQEDFD